MYVCMYVSCVNTMHRANDQNFLAQPMSRALVATSATFGLSLLFHVLRFLQTPVTDPVSSSPDLALDPSSAISPALFSESFELSHSLYLRSLIVSICLIPFCEGVLTAWLSGQLSGALGTRSGPRFTGCCDQCMSSAGSVGSDLGAAGELALRVLLLVVLRLRRGLEWTLNLLLLPRSLGGFRFARALGAFDAELWKADIGERLFVSGLPVLDRGPQGKPFDPPKVFSKFGECEPFVKQGSECGEAIFVGVRPSEAFHCP